MAEEPQQGLPEKGTESENDGVAGWVALVGIGFEFLATVGLIGAAGWWADRRMNTFPWLTLVGGAVGFAAGLLMMVRAAKNAFKD
jgi:F0F1-type ATP synthase assembly protein I